MKIACFGDLHGHIFREFDGVSDKTGSTRLDHIVSAVDYIGQYCLSNDIKYVLFSGDLYNTRGRVNTLVHNSIYDKIKELSAEGLTFIMIPGNHDQYDNSDIPENSLHQYGAIDEVYVHKYMEHDTNVIDEQGNIIPILCVPFSKNADKIKETLARYEGDGKGILLMHAGVSGAVVGSDSYPMMDAFTLEDLCPDKFKYVVLGHYHKKQFLGELPHVFYCGSPIQHSFNDDTDAGFFTIDTSKRWDVHFHPIPSPQFRTIHWTPSLEDWDWDLLQEYADYGDYVRIIISENKVMEFCNCAPTGLKYKLVIEKEYKQETRVDVKIGMSYSEIISKFADEYNPDAREIGLKILGEVEGER